jgi:hypothetical protein
MAYYVEITEEGLYITEKVDDVSYVIGPFSTNEFIFNCEQARCQFAAEDLALVSRRLSLVPEDIAA